MFLSIALDFLVILNGSFPVSNKTFFFPEGEVVQTQAWIPAFVLAYYAFPR
jgi:hypothetical protein